MQAFLQSNKHIATEIGIANWVFDSDGVVIRRIGYEDDNVLDFRGDVVEISSQEIDEELTLFLFTEVVEFVYVGTQMTDYWPTGLVLSDAGHKETMRMHVGTLTDVHFIGVFYQTTEDLEESGNIEQLRADMKIFVSI
jgi:hypothetical protein